MNQEIIVTLLGDSEVIVPAKIINLSGRGMGLEADRPLGPGSALKIELADTLLLGEVIYCRQQGSRYQVGISLDQALYHTRVLAVLAKRLLGDTSRQRSDAAIDCHGQDS